MKIKFHGMKNLWSNKDKPAMGKYVTFQLLSIILLDATLISLFSPFYAVLVSILIFPAYLLTRKLYFT